MIYMTVYVATPVNGRKEPTIKEKQDAAFERVKEIGDELRIQYPDTTITICSFGSIADIETMHEREIMCKCVDLLMSCQAAYFDDGWRDSKGCTVEHTVAEQYNIKILKD